MSKKKNLKILIYGILLTCSIFSINIKAMEKISENKIIEENYENNYLSKEYIEKIETENKKLLSAKKKIENLMKTNYELLDYFKNINERKLINLNIKEYYEMEKKPKQIANEILTEIEKINSEFFLYNLNEETIERKIENIEKINNKSKFIDYYYEENIKTKSQNKNFDDDQNAKNKLQKMADFINNFDEIYSNFINAKIRNYKIKLHVKKYLNESEIEINRNIKQKKYSEHLPKVFKEIRLNTLLTNLEDNLKELDDLKKEQNEISKNKITEYKENIKTLIKQATNILDEYEEDGKPIENENTIRENLKEIDEKIKNNKENKKYSKHLPKVFKELNLNHLLNILEDNLKGLNDLKKEPPEFLENKFIAYRKNITTIIKQSLEILDEYEEDGKQIENENTIRENLKEIDKELNQKFKQIELSSEINKILKTLDEYHFLPDIKKK